jgi:hypothetical protein
MSRCVQTFDWYCISRPWLQKKKKRQVHQRGCPRSGMSGDPGIAYPEWGLQWNPTDKNTCKQHYYESILKFSTWSIMYNGFHGFQTHGLSITLLQSTHTILITNVANEITTCWYQIKCCSSMFLINPELGTMRFYLQKYDYVIIGFKCFRPSWFEWCQQFLYCILLNLTTWIGVFQLLYR